MKKIAILIAVVSVTLTTKAQNFEDIVRFSSQPNFGTARSAAMGGAFAALGGDISAISSNPAGLGVFRKSEISFTPLVNVTTTKSGFGAPSRSSFQLGDLGAVLTFYSPNFNWKGINFSINYSNLNNFNRTTRQKVGYSENSYTDVLAATATVHGLDDGFTTIPAHLAYLINGHKEGEVEVYTSVLDLSDHYEPVAQVKKIEEDGYQGEYTIAFGTNYKDKLYLGMSIGIQSIYYKMSSFYQEGLNENSPSGLDYFDFEEYKKMNGVGTNLKFGVIYRPIPEIRIGASIHTPTWYSMNYDMSTRFVSTFLTDREPLTGRDHDYYDVPSGLLEVDYDMRTPWRAVVGIATVLGQKAIISADYEFIKYTNSRFENASDGISYAGENAVIQDYLRPTHNFRVGAEYRLNSIFSLRAGYSFLDSPYYEAVKKSNNRIQSVSAGIGMNFGMFYCDVAYVHKMMRNETVFYSFYDVDPAKDIIATPVNNKYLSNEARITLGLRF